MTNWTDITDYLPNGFRLRAGAGGGDPRNGMCYMETVSFIAGEDVTDRPECACPVLTAYGINLNDDLPDDVRQRLLSLAWPTAGTRSPEHEQTRLAILGLAACDITEMVLPIFEAKRPNDNRPRKAIKAARAYWANPTRGNAIAARDAWRAAAAGHATRAADLWVAAGAAWLASGAAWLAADAAGDAADAAGDAARAAARGAQAAAWAADDLAPQIWDRAIKALRDAIKAGPHGGIPEAEAIARIEARRDELVE